MLGQALRVVKLSESLPSLFGKGQMESVPNPSTKTPLCGPMLVSGTQMALAARVWRSMRSRKGRLGPLVVIP
jgi:hypothetical protein